MEFSRRKLKYICAISVFLILLVGDVSSTKRRINCTVYSGHDPDTAALNLAHIAATGDHDTVHYLWSTYKVPSVVVARTKTDSVLAIDFEKLKLMKYGALGFNEEPYAYGGLLATELFEKAYSSDTSSIDKPSTVLALGLESFVWSNITNSTFSCNENSASLNLESSSSKDESQLESQSGVFRIQFSTSGNEENAANFPHLVYSGNSTQFKLAIDGIHTQLNSSRTRYGVEMKVFFRQQENCSETDCKGVVEDSVSDEFSPGVFSDVNLITPCSWKDSEQGSFITWRPVAYISKDPTVANSSDANMAGNCPRTSGGTPRSIAELFFEVAGIPSNMFNMTFGTVGAGFYAKTQYTEWSLMLGTGKAVQGKLSVAAIVLLIVGVGGLGLSFLVVAVFYSVRYFRQRDDDSLLVN